MKTGTATQKARPVSSSEQTSSTREIRDVKCPISTYAKVQRFMSHELEKGNDLKISVAAVKLIEIGLQAVGVN